jgi:hypothetical protein
MYSTVSSSDATSMRMRQWMRDYKERLRASDELRECVVRVVEHARHTAGRYEWQTNGR